MTDILRLLLHFGWLLLPVWALIAILWRRRDGWSLLAAVPLTFALLMLSAWAGAAVGMLRSVGYGWQLAALPAAGFLIAGRFRHRRMAFSVFLTRTAKSYALVNDRTFMHFCRFTDNHAHTVVDKHAAFDFRCRMNFNTRKKSTHLTDDTRKQL